MALSQRTLRVISSLFFRLFHCAVVLSFDTFHFVSSHFFIYTVITIIQNIVQSKSSKEGYETMPYVTFLPAPEVIEEAEEDAIPHPPIKSNPQRYKKLKYKIRK